MPQKIWTASEWGYWNDTQKHGWTPAHQRKQREKEDTQKTALEEQAQRIRQSCDLATSHMVPATAMPSTRHTPPLPVDLTAKLGAHDGSLEGINKRKEVATKLRTAIAFRIHS